MPVKQLVLVVAAILAATTVALAESEEGRQACMQDAFKFCSDAIPYRERVFQCLASHRDVISALCRTQMVPSPAAEQQAKEQHPAETKHASHKPKAAKRVVVERPAPKKHAPSTKGAARKVPAVKHASLPAGHAALKKPARETNRATGKATSTNRASNVVARRDGKPLNIVPH
jgi:hypothetical protein